MSDNTGDRVYARDAAKQPWPVWVGLAVFLIGCGCFTVAVVELASNKSISAIAAIIGVPLFIIGLSLVVLKGNLKGED